VLIIGGSVILLIVVSIAGLVWMWNKNRNVVEPIADSFLRQVESQDYDAAYQSLGPEWKKKDNEAAFSHLENVMRRVMGPLQSKTFETFDVNRSTEGSMAVIGFHGVFQNGGGDISLTLMDSTGQWRVVGHRINSPIFIKALTCPNCKKLNKEMSAFCPSCGKPNPILQ
ncbi:MAG TPA: DUF4019 domain-containing protein, partial [Phycisphaerae bacterium]|nr:DUF4019 domain-containing protein [Phycisphaerae bacterium]